MTEGGEGQCCNLFNNMLLNKSGAGLNFLIGLEMEAICIDILTDIKN